MIDEVAAHVSDFDAQESGKITHCALVRYSSVRYDRGTTRKAVVNTKTFMNSYVLWAALMKPFLFRLKAFLYWNCVGTTVAIK